MISFHSITFVNWLIDWFDLSWFNLIDWFHVISFHLLIDWFDLIWFDWWIDWFDFIWFALMDWIGSDDIITYPYAWTVNFKICVDVQLRTYQPPIPKTSQAASWLHRYIGHWMGKTEGSLCWIMKKSKVEWLKKTLGKGGRFRTSGTTFWSRTTGSRFGSISNWR